MTDVHALLEDYIAAHRGGRQADPREWLGRVQGRDRAALEGLIDTYLARAPMRRWDPVAFRESGLGPFAEQVTTALHGRSGAWPALLPQLRDRAALRRAELIERLAGALGAPDRQDKVGFYYHEMEQGLLPSEGVDDKVLTALGSILGQSAEALRQAGRSLLPGAGEAAGGPAAVFARHASPDPAYSDAPGSPDTVAREPAPADATAEPDEIDRLFRGG